jgi:hypothetical protein
MKGFASSKHQKILFDNLAQGQISSSIYQSRQDC